MADTSIPINIIDQHNKTFQIIVGADELVEELATKFEQAGGSVPDGFLVTFKCQGQSLAPERSLLAQNVGSGATLKAKLVEEAAIAARAEARGANKVLFVLKDNKNKRVQLEAEITTTVADLIQVLRSKGEVWGRGLQVTYKGEVLTLGCTMEKGGVLVAPAPDADATLYLRQNVLPAEQEKKKGKGCMIM